MTEEKTFVGRITYNRGRFYDLDCGREVMQILLESSDKKKYSDKLKRGNVIKVTGVVERSKVGTSFISPKNLELLVETRVNIRTNFPDGENVFIESTYNREKRDGLFLVNDIIKKIRDFYSENGFMEVQSRHLHTVPGGTNVDEFSIANSDYLLRSDLDLDTRAYLLSFPKVFQIGTVYRNMGVSKKYSQEFLLGHSFVWDETYVSAAKKSLECVLSLKELCEDIPEEIQLINYSMGIRGEMAVKTKIDGVEDAIKDVMKKLDSTSKILGKQEIKEQIQKQYEGLVLLAGIPADFNPLSKRIKNTPFAEDFVIFWKNRTLFHGSTEENNPDKLSHIKGPAIERYKNLLLCGIPQYSGVGVNVQTIIQLLTKTESTNQLLPTLLR